MKFCIRIIAAIAAISAIAKTIRVIFAIRYSAIRISIATIAKYGV
jgi:hypothetical protein